MRNVFRFVVLKGKQYEEYKKSKVRELELVGERNELRNELYAARIKIAHSSENKQKYIDVDIGDPSPVDTVERKEYVAIVAGLHKEILEPKLKYMISVSHNLLEAVSADRDFDLVMKGVVYSFRELLKWGDAMVSEQVANQTGQNPSSPSDKKPKDEK